MIASSSACAGIRGFHLAPVTRTGTTLIWDNTALAVHTEKNSFHMNGAVSPLPLEPKRIIRLLGSGNDNLEKVKPTPVSTTVAGGGFRHGQHLGRPPGDSRRAVFMVLESCLLRYPSTNPMVIQAFDLPANASRLRSSVRTDEQRNELQSREW